MLASRPDRHLQHGMVVKFTWAHLEFVNAAQRMPVCKDIISPTCFAAVWPTGWRTPRLTPLVRNCAKVIPPFLSDELGKDWEISEVSIKVPHHEGGGFDLGFKFRLDDIEQVGSAFPGMAIVVPSTRKR